MYELISTLSHATKSIVDIISQPNIDIAKQAHHNSHHQQQ